MYKRLFLITLTSSLLCANSELTALQYDTIEVQVTLPNGKTKMQEIEREIMDSCEINVPMQTATIWGGNYASYLVPKECKVTFVKTVGKISPMTLHPEVETFGELEVLDYLQKMNSQEELKKGKMLFIDSRAVNWYKNQTIPSALNIPFIYFRHAKKYPKEFEASLKTLGVKKVDGKYDFSETKTLLTFCNGAWCGQSPRMIHELLKLGYPPQKIKWYRGGMQSWLGLSMTSTKRQVSAEDEKKLHLESSEK